MQSSFLEGCRRLFAHDVRYGFLNDSDSRFQFIIRDGQSWNQLQHGRIAAGGFRHQAPFEGFTTDLGSQGVGRELDCLKQTTTPRPAIGRPVLAASFSAFCLFFPSHAESRPSPNSAVPP